MSIWRGKNIFETSLSGTLLRSYDVKSFTTEPVGAAFNANTLGIFFSDDDAYEVFVVKPGPDGYHEVSRTTLLKPTSPPGNRRELVSVNWTEPAYANRHIYARNDEEIICASLATDGK